MRITIPSYIVQVPVRMFFSLLLFAACLTATAQLSQSAKDSALAEIKQLTNEWNKGIKNQDTLALDKILATEYTLYSYNGSSVDRSGWLKNLKHFTTDSIAFLDELKITVYGNAAKAEGTLYWKTAWDGKPRKNTDYFLTDIWVKRDGRWQVLMRMSELSKP